jgi:hypothetical protein
MEEKLEHHSIGKGANSYLQFDCKICGGSHSRGHVRAGIDHFAIILANLEGN